MPMSRKPAPKRVLPLLDGGSFDLDAAHASDPDARRGVLVRFHRGLHCPICADYLAEPDGIAPAPAARGVVALAVSNDGEERNRAMAEKAAPGTLRFAHSMPLAGSRAWGLYLSASRGMTRAGVEEPPLFAEPGLFPVGPGRSLCFASVQTMPFMRPPLKGLPATLDFVIGTSCHAGGECDGEV